MSSLVKKESKFDMSPQNLTEAKEFAENFSKSAFCPKFLQGKPADTLMVMQLGFELGLKPMQTFKTIGCINGIPFAYGDGKLALVKRSGHYEYMKEWSEGSFDKGDLVAHCTVKRVNGEENTRSFSMAQAKRAGLLSKQGVWQQYPERMMQHRARGFALADTFPDILFGIADEDEAFEIAARQERDITPSKPITTKGAEAVKELLGLIQKPSDIIPASLDSRPLQNISETPINQNTENKEDLSVPELASAQQVEDLHHLIAAHNVPEKNVKKWLFDTKSVCFEEMTKTEIQRCIDYILNQVTKKSEG